MYNIIDWKYEISGGKASYIVDNFHHISGGKLSYIGWESIINLARKYPISVGKVSYNYWEWIMNRWENILK